MPTGQAEQGLAFHCASKIELESARSAGVLKSKGVHVLGFATKCVSVGNLVPEGEAVGGNRLHTCFLRIMLLRKNPQKIDKERLLLQEALKPQTGKNGGSVHIAHDVVEWKNVVDQVEDHYKCKNCNKVREASEFRVGEQASKLRSGGKGFGLHP